MSNSTPVSGIELIASERERQVTKEGYSAEYDDQHASGEMADAAKVYIDAAQGQSNGASMDDLIRYYTSAGSRVQWPWGREWLKISDSPIRNLVKAGALIAAEIDRLQRCQPKVPHGLVRCDKCGWSHDPKDECVGPDKRWGVFED